MTLMTVKFDLDKTHKLAQYVEKVPQLNEKVQLDKCVESN